MHTWKKYWYLVKLIREIPCLARSNNGEWGWFLENPDYASSAAEQLMSDSVLIRSGFASNLIFFLKVSDLYLWPVGKLQQKYVCLLCVNISGNVCVLSSHLNPHANHWPFQYVACKQLCRSEVLKFKVIGIKTFIVPPCPPLLITSTAFVNIQLFSKS